MVSLRSLAQRVIRWLRPAPPAVDSFEASPPVHDTFEPAAPSPTTPAAVGQRSERAHFSKAPVTVMMRDGFEPAPRRPVDLSGGVKAPRPEREELAPRPQVAPSDFSASLDDIAALLAAGPATPQGASVDSSTLELFEVVAQVHGSLEPTAGAATAPLESRNAASASDEQAVVQDFASSVGAAPAPTSAERFEVAPARSSEGAVARSNEYVGDTPAGTEQLLGVDRVADAALYEQEQRAEQVDAAGSRASSAATQHEQPAASLVTMQHEHAPRPERASSDATQDEQVFRAEETETERREQGGRADQPAASLVTAEHEQARRPERASSGATQHEQVFRFEETDTERGEHGRRADPPAAALVITQHEQAFRANQAAASLVTTQHEQAHRPEHLEAGGSRVSSDVTQHEQSFRAEHTDTERGEQGGRADQPAAALVITQHEPAFRANQAAASLVTTQHEQTPRPERASSGATQNEQAFRADESEAERARSSAGMTQPEFPREPVGVALGTAQHEQTSQADGAETANAVGPLAHANAQVPEVEHRRPSETVPSEAPRDAHSPVEHRPVVDLLEAEAVLDLSPRTGRS